MSEWVSEFVEQHTSTIEISERVSRWVIIIISIIIIIIIIRTFIMRKLIQNRKCARQQSKVEQISFQFTAKSGQSISQSQFIWVCSLLFNGQSSPFSWVRMSEWVLSEWLSELFIQVFL